jgi:DNA-binding LytR/AlgR family response regulator
MQPYFFVRNNKQYVKVSFNELIYIESTGNYVRIVADSGTFLAQLTIKQLEKILPMDSFCRVSRSCIVSMDRIISFSRDCVTLKNKKLPFTEKYRGELERRVNIITPEGRPRPVSLQVTSDDFEAGRMN